MANKKAASTAKKSAAKTPVAKKQTTTKVTTVKAVDSRPTEKPAAAKRSPFVGRLNRMPLVVAAIAEFIGTFLLASVIVTQQNQSIVVMFVLAAIVLMVGGISGAHVNPAITIGAWITRKINSARALTYIAAQVLGAMLAVVVLNAFLTNEAAPAMSQFSQMSQSAAQAPALYTVASVVEGKEWALFFAEALGLLILGFAYAAFLKNRDKLTRALAIGTGAFLALTIAGTAAYYAVDGLQQAAQYIVLNPAAAIAYGAFAEFNSWTVAIFIVAPVLGATVGFFLNSILESAEEA